MIWHRRVHYRLGRRGESLLFFGGLDLVYAWSLLTAPPGANPTYDFFATVAPRDAWAVLWCVVGVICIYHALQRYDRFGFVAAIGIKVLWGLISAVGCVTAGVSVGSVGIWLGLAGLVWRISGWAEPPAELEDES